MLSDVIERWQQMPLILRILTAASLFLGITCSILPIIPNASMNVSGVELSWKQMWETKVAISLFVVGPLMIAVAVGVLRRALWVRSVLVVMPVLQFLPFEVVHVLFGAPDPAPMPVLFLSECFVWSLVALFYLFVSGQGKSFFGDGLTD